MSVDALLLHNTVCWIVLLFIGDRAYFLCYLSVIFSQLLMRSWALLNHFVLCVFSLSDRWRLPSRFFECPIRLRAGSWQCHCHCPTSAAAGLLKLPSSAMSRDTVPSVPCQFEVNTSLIRLSRCTRTDVTQLQKRRKWVIDRTTDGTGLYRLVRTYCETTRFRARLDCSWTGNFGNC